MSIWTHFRLGGRTVNPELKGKAVVVGGQRDERGVCLPHLMSSQVRRALRHATAHGRKMCPHAIFVDGHPDRYRDCSEKVHRVLTSFSPQVEMASIDESYLILRGLSDCTAAAPRLPSCFTKK